MEGMITNRKLKNFCWFCLIMGVCLITSSSKTDNPKNTNSYTVICVYEEVELPSGAKALDSYSYLKEIKSLYIPTKMDTGKYTVDVTRIDTDFYQICGTDLYFETQYCYEYAFREEVVLNIKSNYLQTRGEVVFF